jgi:ABC-2 type transport system permease protein
MGLWGIIAKEWMHIVRDFRTLLILFVLPVVQLVLFGYAMSTEIGQVSLRIVDNAGSEASRGYVRRFAGSPFFYLSDETGPADALFKRHKIDAELILNQDPSGMVTPSLVIDGSDPGRAELVRQYVLGALADGLIPPVTYTPVYLYNKELDSAFFFVPGLTSLLVIMVTALLTSLTITREKEAGTFALIKLSPLRAPVIIIGKVIPYLALSILIALLVILSGMLLFGVPVRGNPLLLAVFLILYCLTGLSFGILISTLVSTQQSAMLISLVATLLPTMFLSGFIFPLESMPVPLQWASHLIPARYFLTLLRGLMLKGNTLAELVFPALMLTGFSTVFLSAAVIRFRRYLES